MTTTIFSFAVVTIIVFVVSITVLIVFIIRVRRVHEITYEIHGIMIIITWMVVRKFCIFVARDFGDQGLVCANQAMREFALALFVGGWPETEF